MLEQNEEGDYLKMIKYFRNFDEEKLKDYKYDMYYKTYHHWSSHCNVKDGSKEVDENENSKKQIHISPQTLEEDLHHTGTFIIRTSKSINTLI